MSRHSQHTEISHSNEPFVTQPSHPFSPKWQWFDNSHEYQILNLHEDSQMTFYKYLSEIHQKSAKDLGRLKNEGQVQFAIFLLSHSTCLLSPFFPPLSHRLMSTVWLDWKKWQKRLEFDNFDWKLVINFIWQEYQVRQKVSRVKCPSH